MAGGNVRREKFSERRKESFIQAPDLPRGDGQVPFQGFVVDLVGTIFRFVALVLNLPNLPENDVSKPPFVVPFDGFDGVKMFHPIAKLGVAFHVLNDM